MATNDARLAPTRKPEVEIWRKPHKQTRSTRLPFDFNTIYGRIYHRLAAESYFWGGRLFKNGGRHQFGFSNFEGSEGSGGSVCVTVPNFVAIGQTAAEIWRFF